MMIGTIFPSKEILEIQFLPHSDFYYIIFCREKYLIVGGDKDIKSNLIGIKDNGEVFYLTLDDNVACYAARNIDAFVKELLLFDSFISKKPLVLPDNPSDLQLSQFSQSFATEILKIDERAFREDETTYWSDICEEMEYGVIL